MEKGRASTFGKATDCWEEILQNIPFKDTPVVAPYGKEWILLKNLEVEIDGKVLFIPKGTTTDFASVPRILWWLFPPYDRNYLVPSIVHDFLYWTQIRDRKTADKLFYKLMLKYGTPKWKAKLFYWSVRLFGWIAWKRNKEMGDWDVS